MAIIRWTRALGVALEVEHLGVGLAGVGDDVELRLGPGVPHDHERADLHGRGHGQGRLDPREPDRKSVFTWPRVMLWLMYVPGVAESGGHLVGGLSGADSLEYLSLATLVEATGGSNQCDLSP